jgi:hypothetical protein
MAITKFGVVCSTGNALIRRYVYPDTDAQMAVAANVQTGETLVLVSIGPYPNPAAWLAAVSSAVTTALGKAPGNPRCAIIDGAGNVVNVVMVDPVLDSAAFPGMTLVLDANAGPGWTWTAGGGFVAPAGTPSNK